MNDRNKVLTDSEISDLKSMRLYWQDVRERENENPLMHETIRVQDFIGTKFLSLVEHYLELLAEAEHERTRIKVTKCGEQFNCEFDDRVSIEFAPSELLNMKEVFKERAIDASDYDRQGRERVACEVFTRARKMWEKAREEAEQ